jgi:HAD superfamily hydrolase (TIGR01509 family)
VTKSKLVIFDCDGVLVDSETIACRIELQALAELGHPICLEEFRRRAVGLSRKDVNAMLNSGWGGTLPPDWGERMRAATLAAFATELRPVPGIRAVLAGLGEQRRCVASSSHPTRIALALEVTGLAGQFGRNVFSAVEVARGKPAPDLFLHAAQRMETAAADCLVIEDSVPGITGAKAAGMVAIGFTAGGHCAAGHDAMLHAAGADAVAADGAELAALLADWLNHRGAGRVTLAASPPV